MNTELQPKSPVSARTLSRNTHEMWSGIISAEWNILWWEYSAGSCV